MINYMVTLAVLGGIMSESEVRDVGAEGREGRRALSPGALWAKFKKSIQVTGPCVVPSSEVILPIV